MPKPSRRSNLAALVASMPALAHVILVTLGCTSWTIFYSFTSSELLPRLDWVGLEQYRKLWSNANWLAAVQNLALFGGAVMVLSLVLGFILAALIDRDIRGEGLFRAIFLYPFALSFIVTGLVWRWLLNPDQGLQSVIVALGWESFRFNPLYDQDTVIYGLILAALWQGSGLNMVILLTGLRGVDRDIWRAARVEGIPAWRVYVHIVLPMMRPALATAAVMTGTMVVKTYDLVIAMTNGGPGRASELPTKYMLDNMFRTSNLGQGFAASTTMFLAIAVIVLPWAWSRYAGRQRDEA